MDRKKNPFLMNSIKEEQMETPNGKYFFFSPNNYSIILCEICSVTMREN